MKVSQRGIFNLLAKNEIKQFSCDYFAYSYGFETLVFIYSKKVPNVDVYI